MIGDNREPIGKQEYAGTRGIWLPRVRGTKSLASELSYAVLLWELSKPYANGTGDQRLVRST